MPNSTSHIITPKIGMNSDTHDLNMEKSQYSFALNAAIEDFSGNVFQIQNEGSNVLHVNFPAGYIVMGRKSIPELNRTIFALLNPTTGASEFGEVKDCIYDDNKDDASGVNPECENCIQALVENLPLEKTTQVPYCTYRTIIGHSCFSFDINHPVRMEYRVTNTGVNIYFVDYFNSNRFLYYELDSNGDLQVQERFKNIIGYDPNNCDLPIYSNEIDCNKIKYNPDYSRPCVEIVDVISGGNLLAGTYQVIVGYADALSNPLTKYFPATGHIPIRDRDITVETNYETNKALYIKVNNLEQNGLYQYYNIVIVETINNYPQFKLVATLPITQETYVYTSNTNDFKTLTASDIFFEKPIYKSAATITKANDYLFFGKLKEHKKLNLQQAVSKVKVYWQTKAIAESKLRTPKNSQKMRGYMRDEVYPLALVFEMTDDNDTVAFPLVGPSRDYFQTAYGINVDEVMPSSNDDVIADASCANIERNKLWQTYNTAKVVGTPHQYSLDCDDTNCWEWGDFAYWESTDKYPNDPKVWGDLCGKPIRHFKMPDSLITHIHDGLNGNKQFEEDNIIYPLGFKVDHASIVAALNWAVSNKLITAEEKARIKGYRVVRGNRAGNKSVIAKGLLYDVWNYDKYNTNTFFGNYGFNDLSPDSFLAANDTTYSGSNTSTAVPLNFTASRRYTFHSPDTHFSNPSGSEIKLETEEYGQSEGYFNHAQDQPEYALLSTTAYTLAFAFGVAAAISALEEKECRTYTKSADYLTTQTQDGHHYATVGGSVTNILTAGVLVAASGTSGTTGNINTSMRASREDLSLGEREEEHNRQDFKPFRKTDGSEQLTTEKVDTVTYTTCKGSTYQVLNSNSGLGGLGGFFSGVINALTGTTINGIVYRTIIGLREMQLMLELFETLTPKKNLSIQYQAVGRYNNYKPVQNDGFKIRNLDTFTYLTPQVQTVQERTMSVRVNNWQRESSVYLKTDIVKSLFRNPSVIDDSKVTMDDIGFQYDHLDRRFKRTISSYYAAIKEFKPDQYGSIYNVEYLETSGCSVDMSAAPNECTTYFGGDTFINRFANKHKMPFFTQTRFQMPENSDVLYQFLGNAAYPNYYFNTKQALFDRLSEVNIGNIFSGFGSFLQNVLNVPKSRLDARVTSSLFYQKGYIHLYNYSIPYFLAESDVNVDYRHGENTTDKDFYPHQQDLNFWLQEKNVPISKDNYYFYNKSYSRQNKESVIKTLKPQYKFDDEPSSLLNNRLIYTDASQSLTNVDNWLSIKGNNYWDVPLANGQIISIDGIENAKVLIRCEDRSQLFNAFDTLKTDFSTIQIDKGGLFATRPQDFAITDLGHMGSQHRDILKTEYGHLWTDARRGQIFLLGSGGKDVDELTKYGKKNWFRENLPMQMSKDFPNLTLEDLDNNYKGIGIHLGFDKRFNRFFITKLDYKKLRNDIIFRDGKFCIPQQDGSVAPPPPPDDDDDTPPPPVIPCTEVSLDDPKYFCNKGWTISYNVFTKSWVSYHSFVPNYYVDYIDHFDSGINKSTVSSVWSHNVTNKSYQVYYGKLYPFTIDTLSEASAVNSYVNSIEYVVDVLRYHNSYNVFNNRLITFNKAIVYNDRQNSGMLHLLPKDEEDFSTVGIYPRVIRDGIEIQVDNSENLWGFNEFYDMVSCQVNNIPIWVNDCSNVDKFLNPKAMDYNKDEFDLPVIRGRVCHVRLINDKWSSYKFIFFLTQFNQNRSFR